MASTSGKPRIRTLFIVLACGLGVSIGVFGTSLVRSGGDPAPSVRVRSAADVLVLTDLPGREEPAPVDRVLDLVDPRLRLTVRGADDRAHTVGVAPAVDVDAWLAGTSHERGTWVDDQGALATRPITGADQVPTVEPDWLDLASGNDVEVTWAPEDGSVVAVVRGDGGVDGTVRVELDRRLLVLVTIAAGVIAVVVVVNLVTSVSVLGNPVDDLDGPLPVDRAPTSTQRVRS